MKRLISTLAISALVGTAAIGMLADQASARPNNTQQALADCASGSVSTDIFSFATCAAEEGNDTGNQGTLLSKLGSGDLFSGFDTSGMDWSVLGKSDDGGSVSADESVSGSWSALLGDSFYGNVVVSVKTATGYYAYAFEGVDASKLTDGSFGGQFATANGKDLSHMTIAVAQTEKPSTGTPEPFSMIGAGLAVGMGTWLKKRNKA
ncbi:PEP-CTERM sorting domain-containing protein [Spirulina major CS-329]|uniref:PEP-CTERM sorting domain-containing protein n=1 Tax=Spirulina TaxID=1154 RepID=UPI00232D6BED|nr:MULTISPECIES: PEP-CTERM sorting domain-containing protein [Spirulina]MDB9495930.1 PEP-CTERM sorting domain-containing protein [Spirulina subsalsa CS-330]MDB9501500.1 PEP-CTERM sorting domain-containing protein [Spirulina major CS-329]